MLKNYLIQGEVIAFKTDTVWGFGCNPQDKIAVDKIYEIKKRDTKKPLILMSDDFKNLEKYINFVPDYAYELIEKYLPGGLTLIFEKSKFCPDYITSGGNTVGIRVPNSEDFRKIISQLKDKVLATTSCNIAGENPVMNYLEAKEKFEQFATIIKPINNTENDNIPSTVVLCEKEGYRTLRKGAIEL